MKLHAFILSPQDAAQVAVSKVGGSIHISDESLIKQWSLVLRFVSGERILLYFNETEEAECEFVRLSKNEAELVVVRRGNNAAASALAVGPKVRAYVSLIKGDRFDLIIQKLAELGVHTLVPVVAERSIKRTINMERSFEIAREAAEQSMCSRVMKIEEPLAVLEAIADAKNVCDGGIVFAHKTEVMRAVPHILSALKSSKAIRGFFVGPEGGFSDEEVSEFLTSGLECVSLGQTMLRAETAAIVCAFAVMTTK